MWTSLNPGLIVHIDLDCTEAHDRGTTPSVRDTCVSLSVCSYVPDKNEKSLHNTIANIFPWLNHNLHLDCMMMGWVRSQFIQMTRWTSQGLVLSQIQPTGLKGILPGWPWWSEPCHLNWDDMYMEPHLLLNRNWGEMIRERLGIQKNLRFLLTERKEDE